MKKAVLAVAALVLLSGLFLVPVFADSISGKPEISDFIVEGTPFKVNDERDITFRFMSNRKPEEVIMRFYSVPPMRTVDNIFSSKKEISVEAVDKNNGTYEIVAIKKVRTPPHPSDVEISVWIEGPDGKSNKLTKRVSFATNPRDVTRTDWRNWTRLPEKIDITPPGPEINEKVASLSGIWQGTFDSSGIFVTVVVTEITSSRVAAIYSSSVVGYTSLVQYKATGLIWRGLTENLLCGPCRAVAPNWNMKGLVYVTKLI